MSNVYCSQCGNKHPSGAKFCSYCGNALNGFAVKQSIQAPVLNRPQIKEPEREYDEEGIPTSFVRPSKLSYEIEKPNSNKYTGKELFTAPPTDANDKRQSTLPPNYRRLSKEELLSQSMRECSSRSAQNIDET